jgi:hypothetical protein
MENEFNTISCPASESLNNLQDGVHVALDYPDSILGTYCAGYCRACHCDSGRWGHSSMGDGSVWSAGWGAQVSRPRSLHSIKVRQNDNHSSVVHIPHFEAFVRNYLEQHDPCECVVTALSDNPVSTCSSPRGLCQFCWSPLPSLTSFVLVLMSMLVLVLVFRVGIGSELLVLFT